MNSRPKPDHRNGRTVWLFVKVTAFTLIVPGSVVALLPYLLLERPSLSAIDILGMSMLGAIPILLGAALYLRCAYDFAILGHGTPAPIDAPVQLVTSGPYRFSRNPMYVGVLAILTGEVLLFRDLRLFWYLLAIAVLFNILIIGYEERALRRQFGEAFERYCRSVPRWVPRWSELKSLYRSSFLKVGVVVFAAGAAAHVVRLAVGLPVAEMPISVHTVLVVLPAYTIFGLIVYARRINLPGILRKVVFALIVGHLVITVAMHVYSIAARDNAWLGIFPMWYSAIAAIVFCGFAYFLKTRTLAGVS